MRVGSPHGRACGGKRLRPLLAFALVGVQKSGTTDLTSHIAHHPQLCVKPEARLMGMNSSTATSAIDPSNSVCGSPCARLFGLDDPGGAFSFAFAGGTYAPRAADVLAAMATRRLPLVVLLREPIQRAFSAYTQTMALPLPPSGKDPNHLRYDSFDLCVFLETRWVAGLSHGGLPHGSPPVPARFNRWQSPIEYVRLGLYANMLDTIFAAGYTRWEWDDGDEGGGAAAIAGAPPQLLILVSERLHANESAYHARLWRFLGVPPAATTSSFRRSGSYTANLTLTSWARRRLWHTYRDSTRRTYAHLGGAVPEWEAYYSKHEASAHAEPEPQHLVDATTAPRRAALRSSGQRRGTGGNSGGPRSQFKRR